jgi:hypothetical protein
MRDAEFGPVSLNVYDIRGREAAALIDGCIQPGSYEITFDGSGLASGVYYWRVVTGRRDKMKEMLLLN